jgi:hypothetical protein
VDKTQSQQPHWITPIATTTPRLEEEVRYDQDWLQHADGYTWNEYDGAKGLELIPCPRCRQPEPLIRSQKVFRNISGAMERIALIKLLAADCRVSGTIA